MASPVSLSMKKLLQSVSCIYGSDNIAAIAINVINATILRMFDSNLADFLLDNLM